MGKYLALILIIPLQAFWYIWGFFLAWGAADSGAAGKPFWQLVKEELNGRSPELTELWVFVTIINACLLAFGAGVLIWQAVKKIQKMRRG